mgnify:CR=1 FL=1
MKKIRFKPKILFFTGLSASGKTTLALLLKKRLQKIGLRNIKYIDGDDFRKRFKYFKYGIKQRNEVGDKKVEYANSFIKLKKLVIVTEVAADSSWRNKIKKKNPHIIEIYTKCPISICKQRDFKKNYIKAKNKEIKNFVGVNDKYQQGKSVDITINTYIKTKLFNINKIINFLKKNEHVYYK